MADLPDDLALPAYGRGCVSDVVPELLRPPGTRTAPWLPEPVRDADQIVLLVLDGLGWRQLQGRTELAPNLASMVGGPITSVAPTTTATALTSIVVGATPAEHGIVGYRVRVDGSEGDLVLNVLRWRTAEGDARESVPPASFQSRRAFGGTPTPSVTKAEFAATGFTIAQGLDRLLGWVTPSGIAVEVGRALDGGEPLVYAYYEGVDKVAHARGFGPHYDAELAAADRLVGELRDALAPGAALVVTSDHGQVEVGERVVTIADDVLAEAELISGEGRFLWLHARAGRIDDLERRCRERYEADGLAFVGRRDELVADGWFGGPLTPEVASRLGDVAVVARHPVAFLDPGDPGAAGLRCRHGSLTQDELLVPLVAVGSTA